MSTDKVVLVAFRGTEATKVQDWKSDIKIRLVDGPFHAQVHNGFSSALSHVWTAIEETISKFQTGGKSLWFTGHSLGAALTALAAAKISDKGLFVNGLYTFGQPRTGDPNFAKNFDMALKSKAFRFVNNNDIVPRVPLPIRYRHFGTLCYFDVAGNYHQNMSEWNQLLDRLSGRIKDFGKLGTDGVKDHGMEAYLERVKKCLPL
jgi:triacylglycerol lipase